MSLRQRLLLLVLGTVTFVWVVASSLTYHDARHEINEVMDAHLAQASTLLVAQFAHELDEFEAEHNQVPHKYSRQVAVQVWDTQGKLLFHSANAPLQALAAPSPGFSNTEINGQHWRVFTSTFANDDDGMVHIHVAEQAKVRRQLAGHIADNLLYPLWIALPLLGVALWWAVSLSLRPLVDLTKAVEQRKPDNLAPLTGAAPSEVRPLIERLNHLFARTQALITHERRFTADAAHELRTPLAGIQAQVQVALAAQQEPERKHALNQALQGCQRSAHLIGQLLTLARLENDTDASLQTCHLHPLAASLIAELAPAALEQNIQLELLEGENLSVAGLPALLEVLLRNLLANAINHSGSGTRVQVSIMTLEQHPCLSVCDNGIGLPASELAKITQRFYRPADTQASGSGLGLSIVQRIVDIHRAELRLAPASAEGGLCARVLFGRQ